MSDGNSRSKITQRRTQKMKVKSKVNGGALTQNHNQN